MTLDHDDIEAIAAQVVQLLGQPPPLRHRVRLATAKEVAESLGVGRSWVYAHQERLRAIRLGSGPKSRLRFDLDRAAEVFRVEEEELSGNHRGRLRSPASSLPPGVELIQGKSQR